MGWLFTQGASRRDIIDDLTRDQSTDEKVFRTLRKCFRGNTMYALHESGPVGDTRKWLCVYLLQRDANYGWGYKDMDETMGPCYHDCPVSYLDEADPPPEGGYAAEWRAEVRKRAAARAARKPKLHEKWRLSNGHVYRIISLRPLGGTDIQTGGRYRIPRKMLREKVTETAPEITVREV